MYVSGRHKAPSEPYTPKVKNSHIECNYFHPKGTQRYIFGQQKCNIFFCILLSIKNLFFENEISYYNPNMHNAQCTSIFLLKPKFSNRFLKIIGARNQIHITFCSV